MAPPSPKAYARSGVLSFPFIPPRGSILRLWRAPFPRAYSWSGVLSFPFIPPRGSILRLWRGKLVHRDFLFGDKSNYILVGIRRAGKSYLLYQDIQTRLNKGELSAQDILYINFEDERLSPLKAEELGIILDSYMELYPGKQPFVYLDEIQNIEGWEKFARRLADSQYRVMITGSNAKMLGKEMYSTLGGRYIPKEIFPFSFAEYLTYHQVEPGENWEYNQQIKSIISNYFDSYFYEGGIAESFEQPDKREYLNALYQKILIGDIVEKNSIRNSRIFRFLAKKLADSVMQPSSLTRLQHMVKSTGDTISLPALKDYLEYMQDAYLFFPIPNLVSPMTEQATLQKRYVADNGILNLFLFQGETKLLENMVAIELNRRFRNTTEETLLYYFNKNVEIDFCVPSAQLAIQVSYNLNDEATYEREVGGLIKFLKAFPGYHGYIITRDYQTQIMADGYTIEVVPIWKWLLQDN